MAALITILQWTSYVTAPIFFLSTAALGAGRLIYLLRKWWRGSKYLRIIYVGSNYKISTGMAKIGNEYSDDLIDYDEKTFIYEKSMVRELPKDFGVFSREPFLWYTSDSILPSNVSDMSDVVEYLKLTEKIEKVRQELKANGKSESELKLHFPIDVIQNFNRKTPKELTNAIRTKAITDLFMPSNILGKAVPIILIVIIVLVGLYFVGSKMGWV